MCSQNKNLCNANRLLGQIAPKGIFHHQIECCANSVQRARSYKFSYLSQVQDAV